MTEYFVRSYPLEDIHIRNGGDGRTVEAYAAVFGVPAEIRDQDGHYMEDLDSRAFTRTINNKGTRFGVFYNHGLTIHGTPSDSGSVPIGTPQEVRADNRGLLTVTRYNKTPLADAVLEAINTGAITGQSFTGRFMRSNPARVPRAARGKELPKVTRMEIDLKEYGPTPFPAYQEAAITGVRSLITMTRQLEEAGTRGVSFWDSLGSAEKDALLLDIVRRRSLEALLDGKDLDEETLEIISRALGLDIPGIGSSRGNVPDGAEPHRSEPPATPPTDPAGPVTPPQDSTTGDPAPNGDHSARLARMKQNARKTAMREVARRARTEAKRSNQGDAGGVQG